MTTIKIMDKATLLLINQVGFPIARQIKVQRAEVNEGRLTLQYVEKGKRSPVATRFDKDTELALYDGWHDVNGAMNVDVSGQWTQFDEGVFAGMCSQINQIPVFSQNKQASDWTVETY